MPDVEPLTYSPWSSGNWEQLSEVELGTDRDQRKRQVGQRAKRKASGQQVWKRKRKVNRVWQQHSWLPKWEFSGQPPRLAKQDPKARGQSPCHHLREVPKLSLLHSADRTAPCPCQSDQFRLILEPPFSFLLNHGYQYAFLCWEITVENDDSLCIAMETLKLPLEITEVGGGEHIARPWLSITILSKGETWKLDGFIPSSSFQSNRWDLDTLLKKILLCIIICKLLTNLRGFF
jgi:hypothetical protein